MRRTLRSAEEELNKVKVKFRNIQTSIEEGIYALEEHQTTPKGKTLLEKACELMKIEIEYEIRARFSIKEKNNFDPYGLPITLNGKPVEVDDIYIDDTTVILGDI